MCVQYDEDSAPCLDTTVQMKMSFDNLQLQYVVFKYSMNGTFLGSEEVNILSNMYNIVYLLRVCLLLLQLSNNGGLHCTPGQHIL